MLKDRETAVVTPLAAMCGYAEPCHFSREFARRVGKPPTAYRDDSSKP